MTQSFLLKLIRTGTAYKEMFSSFPLGYFIIKWITKAIAEVLSFTRLKRIDRAADFFRCFSRDYLRLWAFLIFVGVQLQDWLFGIIFLGLILHPIAHTFCFGRCFVFTSEVFEAVLDTFPGICCQLYISLRVKCLDCSPKCHSCSLHEIIKVNGVFLYCAKRFFINITHFICEKSLITPDQYIHRMLILSLRQRAQCFVADCLPLWWDIRFYFQIFHSFFCAAIRAMLMKADSSSSEIRSLISGR